MGKGDERGDITIHAGVSTFVPKTSSEASKMLEAALLQMDDIISGACIESNNEGAAEWKDSVKEAARNLVTAIKSCPSLPSTPDPATVEILLKWMQPNCPLSYTKMIGLRGSVPNLCSTTSLTQTETYPPFCSAIYNMSLCSKKHCCQENTKEHKGNQSNQPFESGTKRRLRNRIDCEQRFRSQTDLFLRRKESSNCCPLQYFQISRKWEEYLTKTEDRLRKLEDERGTLRMEVSVLSEQVEAQSNKIQELESMLREKKDSLRRMEEALQQEMLSRSALETQKLELLSSMSEMKLRQASLEHENLVLRSTSPVLNGEKFGRHTSQYSSLPRPLTSSKKGVVFAEEDKNVIIESSNCRLQEIAQKPLTELSLEEIEGWLANLGLECYAGELRRWGATGAKLLECSSQQIEKELEIKNVLHKKKLLYAIESEKSDGTDFLGSDKMDNAAVLRWLDDIGLPQHKEAFQNGKIDGRMLHRLTTEDLLNLGVNAQLHAASLRRGIQVLRELYFEFDNLERRSINDNGADGGNVHLWTNHRVMEWLRVVDLAEYAPNMRGSGVHGGLMVYEGRFTSELLAALLSISPGKTLLRRHLTTHFNQILGREVVQRKREIENTSGFVPLTLTARLKIINNEWCKVNRVVSGGLDTMSDGVDGGGGENEVDSHSCSHVDAGESSTPRDEETLDPDSEAALNTNYDSSDGAVPAFRCERCENYETINKTALCAHQDQCLANAETGESVENIETVENDGDGEESHSGIRSHRKMFECDVCNMKFSNGANMRRHKMRHTGVKPYECRVCQKRFFRKDHLAEHFTTHSKTLPYHCPICNRGFQRQIAMRAHFQNEHVGQHDMVKSCPLCNYRAATMKCLRLHFFNRHGIDLDNPGPNSSSSLMNSCAPGEAMPSAPLSDSGDSTGNRSADNATPPMHFLTPHIEISIPYPEQAANQRNPSPAPLNGDSPNSPQSADSNSNAPSSSHHQLPINSSGIHRNLGGSEEAITPSISLIPIKQEPNSNGAEENGATSSNLPLPSLIKVSPLKSLLRDDLRRKLSSGSGNNNNNNNNNNGNSSSNPNPHSRGEPPSSTRPDQRTSGLQCAHCRITFPDQTLYFLHKGCHSESNPWKCNICGEQCCNLYQFNSHLLSKSHQ